MSVFRDEYVLITSQTSDDASVGVIEGREPDSGQYVVRDLDKVHGKTRRFSAMLLRDATEEDRRRANGIIEDPAMIMHVVTVR